MRLIQFINDYGAINVGVVNDQDSHTIKVLKEINSTYELAQMAIKNKQTIADLVNSIEQIDGDKSLSDMLLEKKVMIPFHHPEFSHMHITGTGLTHTGSASSRDSMHVSESNKVKEEKTDSMKMFELGVAGGKPKDNQVGAQPEWFYKGNATIVKYPEHDINVPHFSKDASEEPEIVGIYVNDSEGNPYRVGFCIGNELSDHVTEKQNYLYLAHSKLRQCSFGPELLIGDLPKSLTGTSSILRDGKTIWSKKFESGEDNMCHSISNLEFHHFKYELFRQPGEVHAHFFGTATLSFGEVETQYGDVFEIEMAEFGYPLRNKITFVDDDFFAVNSL